MRSRVGSRVGPWYGGAWREGVPLVLLYRREVLRILGVTGGSGADSRVRGAMIERHGGDRATAQGNKRAPGPLYGVSSHAWQALGLAVAVASLGLRR